MTEAVFSTSSQTDTDGCEYRTLSTLLTEAEGLLEYMIAAGTARDAAARGLLMLMSGISEEQMRAGWLNNLSYALWECREEGRSPQFPGITERQCMLLRLLSDECGGWWAYPAEDPTGDAPLAFVTLEDWRAHVAQRWVHRGGFVTPGRGTPSR